MRMIETMGTAKLLNHLHLPRMHSTVHTTCMFDDSLLMSPNVVHKRLFVALVSKSYSLSTKTMCKASLKGGPKRIVFFYESLERFLQIEIPKSRSIDSMLRLFHLLLSDLPSRTCTHVVFSRQL